jgi:hypothetical protein
MLCCCARPDRAARHFYDVDAVGFNGLNVDLNENIAGKAPLISTDSGGGLISFVGSGRFDGNGGLDYPSLTTDEQGFNTSSHVFGGGSFLFAPATTPEPSTFVLMGGVGLGLIGYGWYRRKRPA